MHILMQSLPICRKHPASSCCFDHQSIPLQRHWHTTFHRLFHGNSSSIGIHCFVCYIGRKQSLMGNSRCCRPGTARRLLSSCNLLLLDQAGTPLAPLDGTSLHYMPHFSSLHKCLSS